MANARGTAKSGLNEPIRAKDSRYPIDLIVETQDGHIVEKKWFFNPGHKKALEALRKMLGLKDSASKDIRAETDEEFIGALDNVISDVNDASECLGIILGDCDAYDFISTFDDGEHGIFYAVLEKISAGFRDYEEKSRIAQARAKAEAEKKAKAEAAAFLADRK